MGFIQSDEKLYSKWKSSVCIYPARRRQWHPTLVLLPGKSHGWRGLVGCSPWGHQESDTTEQLHFHFSLSCIGEGNGNPFQCSCLENSRDGGAWWAAIYGVVQSRTQLRRLSSSSSSSKVGNSPSNSKYLLCGPPLPHNRYHQLIESYSVSCSVVFNSLWPHGL